MNNLTFDQWIAQLLSQVPGYVAGEVNLLAIGKDFLFAELATGDYHKGIQAVIDDATTAFPDATFRPIAVSILTNVLLILPKAA